MPLRINKEKEGQDIETIMSELRAVLDSVYTSILAVDKDGQICIVNRAAEEVIGPAEEVLGQNINKVIPESRIMEVIKSGQPQYGQKLAIQGRTVLSNRTPIITNGQIIGAVAAFHDISGVEAISHELQAVRELNTELNTIIDSSADGLVVTDAEGILRRMNRAYETMIGVKKEEFLGQPVTELVRRGNLSDLVTTKVIESGKAVTITQKVRGKEILFTGTPVFNEEGKIVRVIANIRDLTELNLLNRQLQLSAKEVERYRSEISRLKAKDLRERFVFNSPDMQGVLELTLRVAPVDTTVLITGESGSGKEIIARIIYEASKRSDKPFVKINCGALPPNLIESELFGYEGGAFTGANQKGKPGIFEMASGGTLLLDEIGDLPLDLQVKLLRVIQEQEIIRLGGTKPIHVDVRLITATNANLRAMVDAGKFRKDLFFRLNVVNISIPPLRSRSTDIPPLVDHFVRRFSQKYDLVRRVSPDLMQAFVEYDWPGNIRELENTIERMVVLSPGEWLDSSLFGNSLRPSQNVSQNTGTLKEALEKTERQVILHAYSLTGSTRKAAAMLGINQSTVVRKLRLYKRETE